MPSQFLVTASVPAETASADDDGSKVEVVDETPVDLDPEPTPSPSPSPKPSGP